MKSYKELVAVLALAAGSALHAQTNELVIQAGKPGAEIQPTMYGLFFEDINYAADGGLYAELVKNRSFEFPQHFMGWKTFGKVALKDDGPFERNPHYVRLSYAGHPHKQTGLDNEGFFGIGVKKGEEYRFSVWARVPEGGAAGKIRVELADTKSMGEQQAFATADLTIDSKEWKKYRVILKPGVTHPKAVLRIFLASPQTVDLEHVSLFPVDTWKGHENGLRKDLAQALADIKPGVFRFPGGCIVEGTDLASRYDWKKSVGAVENRPLNENRWQYTFPHRFFPDYYQSYGLGFYEFFQLSEEIGAEPLPVLSCGLACQFQNTDADAHVPLCNLDSYIQDALDLIEFANGAADTPWGKVRADMGHPAPFNLKFIGIGNEQWGKEYPERLEPFVKAIRKAHPEIKIVGSSGPDSEGEQFDYLWPEMKRLKADLVDEHFYRPETWFLSQGARYDNYDRKGPKVFAGEYACHGKGKKWNHFHASLLEAAFMTGLERNADIVHMATYAPLFAHVEGWQWRPDMIWFDNLNSVRTVSYYVQQLFATHKGTNVLSLTMDKKPVTGAEGQNGLFASAVYDKNTDEIIVKIANTSGKVQSLSLKFDGLKKKETLSEGRCIKLSSADMDKDNTIENPEAIVPQETALRIDGQTLDVDLEPSSFAVYILKKQKKS
ncbi:alpha-L-arabinofuranosidase C-terminal domain-containing protein [Bacteroides gallinarum]|uniref:alpha-L-arabinofuranosidase C-terminal domain-containing protein n=1 Tax=Bacteroides gallinarum TaxID=376806 RepID=UPI00037E0769|nr:alpha-L-arabinofuranosidase C-terminal domain-containing protein [Bacteroides gallinarum]